MFSKIRIQYQEIIEFRVFFDEPVRLGMQIAFG